MLTDYIFQTWFSLTDVLKRSHSHEQNKNVHSGITPTTLTHICVHKEINIQAMQHTSPNLWGTGMETNTCSYRDCLYPHCILEEMLGDTYASKQHGF